MATFNRGKLRRLCEAGRLVLVGSYHYSDGDRDGGQRHEGAPMPVRIRPADWHDEKPGICYVRADEFSGNAGMAYVSGKDTEGRELIVLHVHSNSNYTFRVLSPDEAQDIELRLAAAEQERQHEARKAAGAMDVARKASAAMPPVRALVMDHKAAATMLARGPAKAPDEVDDRDGGPVEFTETARGQKARQRWAERCYENEGRDE